MDQIKLLFESVFAISHAPFPRKSLKGSARAGLGEVLGPFTLSNLAVASLGLWHSSLGYLPKHQAFPSSFGIQLLRGEGGTSCHPLHPLGLPVGLQDSQVSSGILVHFYGFKQRLEVASTKALWRQQCYRPGLGGPEGSWPGPAGDPQTNLVVVPLDHLQKHRGSVLNWFGEDLEQVAFFIKIHQDFQFLEKRNEVTAPRPTEEQVELSVSLSHPCKALGGAAPSLCDSPPACQCSPSL